METRPFINTTERLAAVVREARAELDMTVPELAAKARVEAKFVADLEANRPRAEIGKTMRVLKALGLQPRAVPAMPSWVFTEEGTLKEEFRK